MMRIRARAVSNLLIFLCISPFCFGQNSIVGNVLHPNGQALEGASVLLFKLKDSSFIKGLMTSKEGSFEFRNIIPGVYYVACSYTGYADTHSGNFDVSNSSSIKVSQIKFQFKQSDLSAVTVTGKKQLFEQHIDRTVINVASSLTNAGTSVLDILMRSPGITVNQQNHSITMNGKDGVFVMLDGKLMRMSMEATLQLLAGMNSSNVEKIELITTPAANFDAEGNAGFIQIVTKRNQNFGTNGSMSATAGYGIDGGPVAAFSFNLNHRIERWNFYGDYSFNRTVPKTGFRLKRTIHNDGKTIFNDMISNRDDYRRNHIGRIGADYDISSKTVIGGLVSFFSNMYGMDALNESNIFVNNNLDTIMLIDQFERHPLNNYSTNVNIVHNFNPNEQLALNLDYIYYNDANKLTYQYNYFDDQMAMISSNAMKSAKETPIKFLVGTADFTRIFGKNTELQSGVKGTFSRFVNDVLVQTEKEGTWDIDDDLTSKHNLRESILAAYTSLNLKIDAKTNSKMGLRYEYTNSNLGSQTVSNIVDRHYGYLFPSIFVSHTLTEKSSYNFSYTRRITRPTFNDMAPFVYYFDPNTLFSGNPALQPYLSDAVKVDYLLKRNIFSLSYTFQKNPITNFVPDIDPNTNKQTFAAANQRNKKIISLAVSLPVTINGNWTIQNNLSGEWQQLKASYKGSPLTITQPIFKITSTHSYTLPANYAVELNGTYESGGFFGLYKLDPTVSLNFGLQKKISPKAGTLLFNVTNFTGPPRLNLSAYVPQQNLDTWIHIRFVVTTFKLTYSKTFGNNKVKESRKRNTGSEEERERVKAS
jgi:hypothetical protein